MLRRVTSRMSAAQTIRPDLEPSVFEFELDSLAVDLLEFVEAELQVRASRDPDKCFGYFPGLARVDGIDSDLPHSEAFAQAYPTLWREAHLSFNFLRLSLVGQPSLSPFHLDSDASTALTGETEDLEQRFVWRALINLSTQHVKRLTYLKQFPFDLPLTPHHGYVQCAPEHVDPRNKRTLVVPEREKAVVRGVILCVSQVLHSGNDEDEGHFIASYGHEQAA